MIPFRSNPIMQAIVVAQIFASAPIPPLLLIFLFDSSPFFFGWVGQRDFFQTKNKNKKMELPIRREAQWAASRVSSKRMSESRRRRRTEKQMHVTDSQGGEGLPSTGKVGAKISSLRAYCASRTLLSFSRSTRSYLLWRWQQRKVWAIYRDVSDLISIWQKSGNTHTKIIYPALLRIQ